MSEKDNGGFAFPSSGDYCDPRGMTLRDWFAGIYLIGMSSPDIHMSYVDIASECYKQADVMLAERNK